VPTSDTSFNRDPLFSKIQAKIRWFRPPTNAFISCTHLPVKREKESYLFYEKHSNKLSGRKMKLLIITAAEAHNSALYRMTEELIWLAKWSIVSAWLNFIRQCRQVGSLSAWTRWYFLLFESRVWPMASLPVTWMAASRQAAVLLDDWSFIVALTTHSVQFWPTSITSFRSSHFQPFRITRVRAL
jgi:hypothetical protein